MREELDEFSGLVVPTGRWTDVHGAEQFRPFCGKFRRDPALSIMRDSILTRAQNYLIS